MAHMCLKNTSNAADKIFEKYSECGFYPSRFKTFIKIGGLKKHLKQNNVMRNAQGKEEGYPTSTVLVNSNQ